MEKQRGRSRALENLRDILLNRALPNLELVYPLNRIE